MNIGLAILATDGAEGELFHTCHCADTCLDLGKSRVSNLRKGAQHDV